MIIFNWNIHEIDKARKMAKELEMEFELSQNAAPEVDILTKDHQGIFDASRVHKVNLKRIN